MEILMAVMVFVWKENTETIWQEIVSWRMLSEN